MRAHPEIVDGILEASFEANDEMRKSDAALRRASAISSVVYHESGADAAYVYRYFKGVTEPDKKGLMVQRGGSSVNNMADNCQLFGVQSCAPGSTSIFRATYETFGNIVVQQYPNLVPSYEPFVQVVDPSFLERIAGQSPTMTVAEQPKFEASRPVAAVVSRKAWHINFATGSASFTSDAQRELNQLFDDLVIAGSAVVEVHGHTDSAGNAGSNQTLSETRAFAVKTYLEERSPANFPAGRVRVYAHGQEQPVALNTTAEGRAQNRRVEIVIGTTN